MGALTENRKRCFIDLCFPSPIPNTTISHPSKKPKVLQSQIVAVEFPPPSRLSRKLHGPQRILRVFNLGKPKKGSSLTQESFKMGNFFSNSRKEERMRLEEYKKLVKGSRLKAEAKNLGLGIVEEIYPRNLEVEEENVVNRKVKDARKVVEESVEVTEKKVRVKSELAYKRLYGEAKKRDSYLSSLAFEAKLAEERLSGFRSLPKRVEEKPRQDLHELFSPLTNEEEVEVSCALQGGKRRQLLVTHKTSNIEITREVLQCLNYGAWLNDEVINLYLELLKERERREPQKFLNCHFFNTFFYRRLISGKNGYDYAAVKRWTTQRKLGYSLVDCDKIIVPIHKAVHWCLAVIHVKDETFEYLDSLGDMDTNVLSVLARYFMDEAKDKSNKNIDTNSWKQVMADDLPRQKNGWDCGMFMLKYIDFYSRGLGLHFSQEHMDYFRVRTAKEILRLRAD